MAIKVNKVVREQMFEIKNAICNAFVESVPTDFYDFEEIVRDRISKKTYWFYRNVNWKRNSQGVIELTAKFNSNVSEKMVERLLESLFKLDLNITWTQRGDKEVMHIDLERFF